MKRPIGVILSCVVLGMFALFALAGAAFSVLVGVFMSHSLPAASAAQGAPPPPAGLMEGIFLVMGFFALAFGVWTGITVYGLARLRNWARISITVLSVCIAGLGLLAILGTVVAMFATAKTPMPPNLPAGTMQLIFGAYLFVYGILVAISGWWLVYFNQRKTRGYFLPHYAADPNLSQLPYGAPPPPPPPSSDTALAAHLSGIPIPVTILASLMLIGSPMCALFAFLPTPAMFFGVILHRPASSLLYLAFAAASAACAIGLFRVANWGRMAVYAYMVVGLINFVVLATPWGQHRYAAYNQAVSSSMHAGATPAANPFSASGMLIGIFVLMAIFYALQIWVLEHYRYVFLKQPPPAPDPLKTPLIL